MSTGPSLSERDGKLRENWYIACLADELRAGKPLARVIYDQPLALFRDGEGRAVCLPDRCLHRHTPLSRGTVEGGRLVCPYHGWEYDGGGAVAHVPSCGATMKPGLRLGPKPVCEQDGCVWVWMGDGPAVAPPPWRFPFRGEKGWVSYFMTTDFAGEVTSLAENFMDVPHTIFVHKGWFRRKRQNSMKIDVETDETSVLVTYHDQADHVGFTGRILNPRLEPVRHTDHFIMPNITRVDYWFGTRRGFVINSQCTPVSALQSRVYTFIAYKLGRPSRLLAPFLRFYTRRVIEQDVDVIEMLAESLRRDRKESFHHTAADVPHVAIERLRARGVRGAPERQGATAVDGGAGAGARRKQTLEIWV